MAENKREFKYYYQKEGEQFSFYRIPKLLFKDEYYKKITCESKVAYGLMLDRMELSRKNNWVDEEGRIFIVFTYDDLKESIDCSQGKASSIFNELENIGLIKRVRRGLGLPSIIYVMNFVSYEEELQMNQNDELYEVKTIKMVSKTSENSEVQNLDFKKSKNETSRNSENRFQEVQNLDFKKSKKRTSRNSKNKLQEIQKEDFLKSKNQTEIKLNNNKTEMSNTNQSINPSISSFGEVEMMDGVKETVAQKISLEELKELAALSDNPELELNMLEEVYDVICDALNMPDDKNRHIRINSDEVSISEIKKQYRKLDKYMVSRVLNNVIDKDLHISNMSGYLIAALYNEAKTGILKNQSGQADEYFRARRGDPYKYVT